MTNPAGRERRSGRDRRRRPTPMFSRYTFWGGRRRGGRRAGEDRHIYVDRYDGRTVLLFAAILLLNVLDAYFTLAFLQLGGEEANPIARFFLGLGSQPFLFMKTVVVGACLLVLVVHKTFYNVPRVLTWICLFYGLLLVYHIALRVTVFPALAALDSSPSAF